MEMSGQLHTPAALPQELLSYRLTQCWTRLPLTSDVTSRKELRVGVGWGGFVTQRDFVSVFELDQLLCLLGTWRVRKVTESKGAKRNALCWLL
jgi:hypothetical protein